MRRFFNKKIDNVFNVFIAGESLAERMTVFPKNNYGYIQDENTLEWKIYKPQKLWKDVYISPHNKYYRNIPIFSNTEKKSDQIYRINIHKTQYPIYKTLANTRISKHYYGSTNNLSNYSNDDLDDYMNDYAFPQQANSFYLSSLPNSPNYRKDSTSFSTQSSHSSLHNSHIIPFRTISRNHYGTGKNHQLVSEVPRWILEPPRVLTFSNSSGGSVSCQVGGVETGTSISWIHEDGRPVEEVNSFIIFSFII